MTFNLNDIKHFLLEKNYPEWDMQVIDRKTGDKRLATMEDFNYSRIHSLTKLVFNCRFGEITKDMHITDFKFLTYDEESNIMGSGSNITLDEVFSKDWIDFLLFKHKKEYAKVVFDWGVEKIANIQNETNNKIKEFTKSEMEKYRKKIKPYNKIVQDSMKYLEDEDILNPIEDINIY